MGIFRFTLQPLRLRHIHMMASLTIATISLSGCVTGGLSGITGGAYTCKAPVGTGCQSVSANYDNAIGARAKPPPDQGRTRLTQPISEPLSTGSSAMTSVSQATPARVAGDELEYVAPPSSGMPLRSPPRTLRIWLAPGEDADGLFHDQRFVYVVVDQGRWQPASALRRLQTRSDDTLSSVTPAQPAPDLVALAAAAPTRAPKSAAIFPSVIRVSPVADDATIPMPAAKLEAVVPRMAVTELRPVIVIHVKPVPTFVAAESSVVAAVADQLVPNNIMPPAAPTATPRAKPLIRPLPTTFISNSGAR